ncbi:protein of unknown function DUF433 [Gloeothece citriformis PCC 7424]|uniref:DUF433 domain-containing protein n=1 Tax=Gloeothece citriformis (strain PCC 7424) TaxID=65393 RepID=B7K7N8_GLOC7|nr:DUF433 domain-containing protein [Gloeothece citriformis]ACK69806.1 protein of unknown function DUF433 [Gloeothece citriformis PCC 7424]
MQELDRITLKSFLIALEELGKPLPKPQQTDLITWFETTPNYIAKLDQIAEKYLPLEEIYQEIRTIIQEGSRHRFKSGNSTAISNILIEELPNHLTLTERSKNLLGFDDESLLAELKKAIQSLKLESLIKKNPGICGGDARIRDTRIPVWTLVSFRKQGASNEELLRNYPGLTQQDLTAAWTYYANNKAEIEQIIDADDD